MQRSSSRGQKGTCNGATVEKMAREQVSKVPRRQAGGGKVACAPAAGRVRYRGTSTCARHRGTSTRARAREKCQKPLTNFDSEDTV